MELLIPDFRILPQNPYASPAVFPRPTSGLLPARAGSPFAGRASQPLDDTQSFMKASQSSNVL
jgi:hypothetical protein